MSYWILEGRQRSGPFTAQELVWNRKGNLMVLVSYGAVPAENRREWKPGWLYRELEHMRAMLPQ